MRLGELEDIEIDCFCYLETNAGRSSTGWAAKAQFYLRPRTIINTGWMILVEFVEGAAGASRGISAHQQGAVVCDAPAGVLSHDFPLYPLFWDYI